MKKKITIKKICIIGYGSIAKKHISVLKKINPNIIFYILSRKKHLNQKKIFFFNNFNKIDQYNIDLYFICSPANTHYFYIKKIVERKKNFLVEKPLGLTKDINNLKNIFKSIRKFNLKSLVGYQLTYDDAAKYFFNYYKKIPVKDIIGAEIVCKSHLDNWRKNNLVSIKSKYGGGVLYELSHELEYMKIFFGEYKSFVTLKDSRKMFNSNVEENKNIIFKMKKNFNLLMTLSFNSHENLRYCKLHTKKFCLVLDWNIGKVKILNLKSKKEKIIFKSSSLNLGFDRLYNQDKFCLNYMSNKKLKINHNSFKNSIDILETIKKIYSKSLLR